jgi:hypothetical protein
MYNNTDEVNADIIEATIIFPICVMIMFFVCSIGRYLFLTKSVDESPPKYVEDTRPPKYEEIV